MFRQNTYNEGSFYQLVPVARKAVVPGESAAIDVDVRFESEPFSQNVMSGGIFSLYAFYTPYRLVWSDWVNWLAEPQSAAVVPSVNSSWPFLFEGYQRAAGTLSPLGRRAYKLLYNQYFGQQQYSSSWYADITLDTDQTVKNVRTTDQFNGKLQSEADIAQQTFTGTVAGSVATLNLNDLRQALRNAYSGRRADMTGDKYVDALARMGVNLDWRVQMAPEFLGMQSCDFMPRDSRASDATNTGRAWSRYQGQCSLKTPRRFFAEHGIVWVVAAMRPHDYPLSVRPAADAIMLNRDRDTVFLGDNDSGTFLPFDADVGANTTGAGQTYRAPRFTPYLKGQNLIGSAGTGSWAYRQDKNAVDVIYPGITTSVTLQDQLPTGQFAVHGQVRFNGPTPVKANIL